MSEERPVTRARSKPSMISEIVEAASEEERSESDQGQDERSSVLSGTHPGSPEGTEFGRSPTLRFPTPKHSNSSTRADPFAVPTAQTQNRSRIFAGESEKFGVVSREQFAKVRVMIASLGVSPGTESMLQPDRYLRSEAVKSTIARVNEVGKIGPKTEKSTRSFAEMVSRLAEINAMVALVAGTSPEELRDLLAVSQAGTILDVAVSGIEGEQEAKIIQSAAAARGAVLALSGPIAKALRQALSSGTRQVVDAKLEGMQDELIPTKIVETVMDREGGRETFVDNLTAEVRARVAAATEFTVAVEDVRDLGKITKFLAKSAIQDAQVELLFNLALQMAGRGKMGREVRVYAEIAGLGSLADPRETALGIYDKIKEDAATPAAKLTIASMMATGASGKELKRVNEKLALADGKIAQLELAAINGKTSKKAERQIPIEAWKWMCGKGLCAKHAIGVCPDTGPGVCQYKHMSTAELVADAETPVDVKEALNKIAAGEAVT